jgi:hypothetical protein
MTATTWPKSLDSKTTKLGGRSSGLRHRRSRSPVRHRKLGDRHRNEIIFMSDLRVGGQRRTTLLQYLSWRWTG